MAAKRQAHLAVLCCARKSKGDSDTSCADLVRLRACWLHLSNKRSELAVAPSAESRRIRVATHVAPQLASRAKFSAAASVGRFSLGFGARLVLGEHVTAAVAGVVPRGGSLREIVQRWSS